jgi:hypothetical protein
MRMAAGTAKVSSRRNFLACTSKKGSFRLRLESS